MFIAAKRPGIKTCVLTAIVLCLNSGSGTAAEEPFSGWQDSWVCGQNLHPEKQLVQQLISADALHAYQLDTTPLPILVGELPEQVGTVMFVKQAGQWQLWPVAAGHAVMGLYSTPAYNRLLLFSMWSVEGPGNAYTLLRVSHSLADKECTTLAFPDELNQPVWNMDFLNLVDVNIDQHGQGALLGNVSGADDAASPAEWFRYSTHDWGKTWSKPHKVPPPQHALPGVFVAATAVRPSQALLNDLLQQAR